MPQSCTHLLPEEPWALDPALTNSSSHLTDTGEESAKANSDSDPTLSAPFERAAALYYDGRNPPWPLAAGSKL